METNNVIFTSFLYLSYKFYLINNYKFVDNVNGLQWFANLTILLLVYDKAFPMEFCLIY